MDDTHTAPEGKPSLVQALEHVQQEYERTQAEVKELELLVRQSSAEVDKLSGRHAQIANRLRLMEAALESVPRQDLKEAYTAAQEAQMRLFTTRGQMEQLQAKIQILGRTAAALSLVLDTAARERREADSPAAGSSEPSSGSEIVRIIDAQESERQHLARLLHDGPVQSLANLILHAEICERLFDKDVARARAELVELKEAVTRTFQKVRGFVFDLRPMMLDDLGLNPTVKRYLQDYEARTDVKCGLSLKGKEQRLPSHIEVTVFRVLQGLLSNVQRHAHATRVDVVLNLDLQALALTVEDDGGGFDLDEVMARARLRKTMGIIAMIEQVERLGGEITFDSAPGRGARAHVRLPA